jgi:hypothetical protein
MGVTAIRKVRNNSNSIASIVNNETPDDTKGGKGDVQANSEKDLYMWIPWCTDSGGFAKHHIQIDMGDGRHFSIWQANLGGSDHVRLSTDNSWHNPGDLVPGSSQVDGDRTLVIDDQGISLEECTSPIQNPSNQAQSGKVAVSFSRPTPSPSMPSGDVFYYTGASGFTPKGSRINRFTNTAKDKNGEIAIPLRISFVDSAGYLMPAGASLRIYTGHGTNTAHRYYSGRRKAVWNNPGDSIRLFTPTGGIVCALLY